MIIAPILGIVLGTYIVYRENKHYGVDWPEGLFYFMFGCFVGSLAGIAIGFMLPADTHIHETQQQIQVLNDNNSTSGSFFLGTGQVEGKMKYVFYSKNGNRYKLNQVDYTDAEIEYSKEAPVVITYDERHSDTFLNWFAMDFTSTNYLFKIPEGSIATGYNLDAK